MVCEGMDSIYQVSSNKKPAIASFLGGELRFFQYLAKLCFRCSDVRESEIAEREVLTHAENTATNSITKGTTTAELGTVPNIFKNTLCNKNLPKRVFLVGGLVVTKAPY